ncbi:MAG TPA: uracil-DNA glycosylase family protein [Acidimicrobiales bacterium]|nr:uracil-DNA glycosylase family protein [Acidimicrobiales bacterium]
MDDLRAGRGDPWDHDPGPPRNRSWARLFAETPDYRALGWAATGEEAFRWQFGPVFYRGRLGDNQARVLVIGQDAGSDEAMAHRSFVGESGTRLQHLLAHLGITRSYLCLNTFVYSITGQYGGPLEDLAQDGDAPLARHRHRLLDYAAARNDLRLVIAVGRAARETVVTWNRHRGGAGGAAGGGLHLLDATAIGPHVRLVDVTHPGAAANPGGLADVEASFAAAADRVLRWAADAPAWLPADPGGQRAAPGTFTYLARPIPLRDLPFGTPWRIGSGGTGTRRSDGGRAIELGPAVRPPGTPDYPGEPPGGDAGYAAEEGDLPWEPPRQVVEFDRGPTPATARLLVGAAAGLSWPGFGALGVAGAPTFGGGALHRGRFTGVRLLVLADQAGHDDLLWGRAFTGDAGQRFQGLLAALGLTRSYLILRTLPVDTAGVSAGKLWALADRPDVVALHRAVTGRVLDDNPVAVVVTVGQHAERIAGRLDLDGQPVVSLPAWRSPGARDAWAAAHTRLRSLGIPIDAPPTAAEWNGERAQIPRADLPFGFPRWLGTSGDRAVRSTAAGGDDDVSEPYYKVWMPAWVGEADGGG